MIDRPFNNPDRRRGPARGHRLPGPAQRVWIAVLTGLLFCLSTLAGLAQDQRILQQVHSSWTAREGAPQNINTLAQTSDGMLWLGTRSGLYSFDGLAFTLFPQRLGGNPRQNVQHLFATRDGYLWAYGALLEPTRIGHGKVEVVERLSSGKFSSLDSVQQDPQGTVWAIVNQGELARLGPDDTWQVSPGPVPGLGNLTALSIDSQGTQWAVQNDLLYRRAQGQTSFTSTHVAVNDATKLEEGANNSLWIAGSTPDASPPKSHTAHSADRGFKHFDAQGHLLASPVSTDDVSDVLFARDGTVWVSHVQSGLQRLRSWEMGGISAPKRADAPDMFGRQDGLLSGGYRAMLRDRDDAIWVAGARGLDKFDRATLVPVIGGAMAGLWSVCAAAGGDVWIASADNVLAVQRAGRLIYLKDGALPIGAVPCKNTTVKLLDEAGISEIHHDKVEHLPLLPGHSQYAAHYRFTSVLETASHQLLAGTVGVGESGLWLYRQGHWKPLPGSRELAWVGALMRDSHGRIYVSGARRTILILEAGSYKLLSSTRTSLTTVIGFAETNYGIFAYGSNGIALQVGDSFQQLVFEDQATSDAVTGLVEARNGDVWVNGSHAILHIPAAEMRAARMDPHHRILSHEVHEGEFSGSDQFYYARDSAQIDSRGTLWFATSSGVISIDPNAPQRRQRLPSVSIRSVLANGEVLSDAHPSLRKGEPLELHYFGLNLAHAAGVVYQYRLVGFDTAWRSAGTRSETIYTRVPPGKYVFEVRASNGDDLWSEPVDSQTIIALPAFYETWWFKLLCYLAAGALLWGSYALRVRYVSHDLRIRANERADERIRIARELHDTLLQGFQGLMLSFHVASAKLPKGDSSRLLLERALDTADGLLIQGRNRIASLRAEHMTDGDLPRALEEAAGTFAHLSTAPVEVIRTGGDFELREDVAEQVFYIAREALTNACRHAGASKIKVTLHYGAEAFSMTCGDNGRGFEKRANQPPNGRTWGMQGMQERALQIGARLETDSAPGRGTEIRIILSARRAYDQRRFFHWPGFRGSRDK